MKRLKVIYLFVVFLLSGMMVSCNSKAVSNVTGQVEIKVYPNNNNVVSFSIEAKSVEIDWGDGNTDDISISEDVSKSITHKYSNQHLQIIRLNTKAMKYFSFRDDFGTFYELKFDNCSALEELKFQNGQLTSLDVRNCPALLSLWCWRNQLTSLDVINCPALYDLQCMINQLTSLDVSYLTNLQLLSCYNNQLTSLNISKCTKLNKLWCWGNQLSTSELNALFNNLPQREQGDNTQVYCGNNLGYTTCDKSIAENRGWTVSTSL